MKRLLVLALLAAACTGGSGGVKEPSGTSRVTGTASAPTATPHTSRSVLWRDDFSDSSSGWSGTYSNGTYVIPLGGQDLLIAVNEPSHKEVADMRVAADVRVPDDEKVYGGVGCRMGRTETTEGYTFVISRVGEDGAWLMSVWRDGQAERLDSGTFRAARVTRVDAHCAGKTLTLRLDGKVVAEATDETYGGGLADVVASGRDARVSFDNFLATII